MIGPIVLASLIRSCEPTLPAELQSLQVGVVMTETAARLRWNPNDASLMRAYQPSAWAIHDDNTDETYCVSGFSCPTSFDDVVTLAATMIARDHLRYGADDRGVDLGLAQINSSNLASHHVTVPDVLHACKNLSVSGEMLAETYAAERRVFPAVIASDRTLEVYNSGNPHGAPAYTENVYRAMRSQYANAVLTALASASGTPPATSIVAATRLAAPVRRTTTVATPPPTQFAGSRANVFTHNPTTLDPQPGGASNVNGGPHGIR